MKSRFLVRMDELIDIAESSSKAVCLNLETASYLARRGDHIESRSIVHRVRSEGQHLKNGTIGAWLNFAEGMQFHSAGNASEAKLKWQRCLAIARSANANEVVARVSAWLAFVDYTNLSISSLISNTREALSVLADDNLEAIARTNLTAAQVFHLCGDYESARLFYEKSRTACLGYCDDVMLAALIHNMAWLRVSARRNQTLQGLETKDDGFLVEAAAESTSSYEKLIDSKGLDVMTPLLGAQVDIMFGRYAVAIEKIGAKLKDLQSQGLSRLSGVLIADCAYCRAQIGDIEGAKNDAIVALESISAIDHVDDLAVLFTRVSTVFKLTGDLEKSTECIERAKELWSEFMLLRKSILVQVGGHPGFVA